MERKGGRGRRREEEKGATEMERKGEEVEVDGEMGDDITRRDVGMSGVRQLTFLHCCRKATELIIFQ